MKLVVAILTPLSVVAFGWLINNRLKKLDLIQWSNQKLIEKRLLLYDELAPLLNALFCFYWLVGHWRDISPADVIETKRKLDKTVNIYRHLLGETFYTEYEQFIGLLFETYAGRGRDPLIRSLIDGPFGDRTQHSNYEWHSEWNIIFAGDGDTASRQDIKVHYYKVMNALKESIGIQ